MAQDRCGWNEMKTWMIPLVVLSLLGACQKGYFSTRQQVEFDGVSFRTKSEVRDKEDKKSFAVTVRPVSASFTGAREAGRWEATRYCVRRYGSSVIKWEVGPDDEPTTLPVSDDRLTLTGRCDP